MQRPYAFLYNITVFAFNQINLPDEIIIVSNNLSKRPVMRTLIPIAIISCVLLNSCGKKDDTGLLVSQIKCSGLENPAGTGPVPDFSWILKASDRGKSQTAYQIIVGADSDFINSNQGITWDSGKILSDASSWIRYNGTALASSEEYFWRVRVWNDDSKPSKWSKTGKFVTGLFEKQDWNNARWIGYEDIPDSLLLVPGIHGNGDNLGSVAKKRTTVPYFRKEFQIKKKIVKAYAFVSGLGQYELYINGNKIGDRFL
jgi:alpha-L-rhamnosidase